MEVEDDDDESPQRRSGLVATIQDSERSVARVDQMLTFDLSKGIDERVSLSEFQVKWSGFLLVQAPGDYVISAHGRGKVEIQINGKPCNQGNSIENATWMKGRPVRMEFGWHPIEIHYSPEGKLGRLGFYWEGPNFGLEPIVSRFLSHEIEVEDAGFARGKELARAYACENCHGVEPADAQSLAAPKLTQLQRNMQRQWLIDSFGRPRGEAQADAPF